MSSSLLGWAAMPVRSGPTLPPSPEWVWHLAHCCLKTSLPCAASPPFRTTGGQRVDDLLAVGVGQAAALGEQRLGPVGDRPGPGGRPGPASGRARAGDSGPCPPRSPSSEGAGPVGPAEQRQDRPACRDGRASSARSASTSGRPDLGRVAPADGVDQAGRQLGRRPRRDQGEQRRERPRRRSCGTRSSCRAASMRGGVGSSRRRPAAARRSWRSRRRSSSSPLHAPARGEPEHWPRESARASAGARRSPSRRRRRASGGLVLGPAPGEAGDDRPRATFASASASWRQELAERRVAGAAPGVVLGDARDDRTSVGARRPSTTCGSAARRGTRRRACAAAAAAASASQRSSSTGPPTSTAAATAADVGSTGRHRPAPGARRAGPAARGRSGARPPGSRGADGVARQRPATAFRRTPADGCVERRRLRRRRATARAVEHAQAVQRPEGVDRAGVQADRVDATCPVDERDQVGTTSVLPRSTSSRWACSRQNMLSLLSAATSPFGSSVDELRPLARLRRPSRRSGRSGRGSCRAAGSRRRRPCRS